MKCLQFNQLTVAKLAEKNLTCLFLVVRVQQTRKKYRFLAQKRAQRSPEHWTTTLVTYSGNEYIAAMRPFKFFTHAQ